MQVVQGGVLWGPQVWGMQLYIKGCCYCAGRSCHSGAIEGGGDSDSCVGWGGCGGVDGDVKTACVYVGYEVQAGDVGCRDLCDVVGVGECVCVCITKHCIMSIYTHTHTHHTSTTTTYRLQPHSLPNASVARVPNATGMAGWMQPLLTQGNVPKFSGIIYSNDQSL